MEQETTNLLPVFVPIATLLIGFALGFFEPWLKGKFYGPALRANFDKDSDKYVKDAPRYTEGGSFRHMSRCLRIGVENCKGQTATDCRAFLTKLEIWHPDNQAFQDSEIKDPLQLKWANRPGDNGFVGIEIPKGVEFFAELVSFRENGTRLQPHYDPQPRMELDPWFLDGPLKATVTVTSKEGSIANTTLTFKLGTPGLHYQDFVAE